MALPGTVTVPVRVKVKWPLMLRLWLALFRWRDRRWRRKNPVEAGLVDHINRRIEEIILNGELPKIDGSQPYTFGELQQLRFLGEEPDPLRWAATRALEEFPGGLPPVDGEGKDIT